MTESNLQERDCTELCKSVQHGTIICGTLTKRQVLDCDICAYIQLLCSCCENVKDSMGRTALHIAASCGRLNISKWLIKCKHANINVRDTESGYTPLHRSIFYGKINVAVHLIKLGANLTITDFNGLTSLEHAMKDAWRCTSLKDIHHGEVYVWGSNTNYTFGTQETRVTPEMLYAFHKEYSSVKIEQICLEKFHCLLVSSDGKVYACGHGQGGRLGLGSEKTVITPKQIKFSASGHANPVICKKACIAVDHSIFLSESGHVWTTGLNTYRVLGIQPPPTQILAPCPLPLLHHSIQDVCAAKYHSVAWGPTGIYTWGLHGGQLGHAKSNEKYVVAPKLVTVMFGHEAKVSSVAVSVGATAVLTSKGDIYIMHDYHCRLILKKQLNLISISVIGGKLNEKLDNCLSSEINHELKVLALSNVGNLYLWQSSSPQFARCIFSINRSLSVRQVVFNLNEILFVTNEGEAFRGVIKPRKIKTVENNLQLQKSDFHEFIDSGHLIKISKVPHVHRALSINSDLKGSNYAVLQAHPNVFVKKLPLISRTIMEDDMCVLLQDATEDDAIHDVVFKVVNAFFPAHRYIIASCGGKLHEVIGKSKNDTVEITDVHPEIFEQLLLFIYTGSCQLLKNGKWKLNPHVCSSKETEKCPLCFDSKNPVRLLQEVSKRFAVKSLQKQLDNVFYDENCVTVKNSNVKRVTSRFSRNSFPEMQDVILKSKDGVEVPAHKCILSARLEYFNSLFSVRWNEDSNTKEVSLPFPYSISIQLIEFLYTDELPLLNNEDIDHICQLLIIADQLFVIRLKEICEYSLTFHITLKNVSQMISFASIYNAHQLKSYCMEFISVNLSSVLEMRSLESLDDDILFDLTQFYSNFNPVMEYRVITPYSYAPSDEIVCSASSCVQISFEAEDDCYNVSSNKNVPKTQKKRSRVRKNSSMDSAQSKDGYEVCVEKPINSDEVNYVPPENTLVESEVVVRVKSRLKALETAQTVLLYDDSQEFTKLPLRYNNINVNDFPELNSVGTPQKSSNKAEKTEPKYNKISKLSQKQRKRLSSESSVTSVETNNVVLSESPKNPWKIPSPLSCSPTDAGHSFVAMQSIIIEERKQKQNFVKMKTKLLVHTQLEDKAIEDLHKFYNVDNVFDEIISIQRVQNGLIASPVWVR